MHQATKQIGALDVVSKVRKSEASRHASTDPDGKKGGLGQASSRTWAWWEWELKELIRSL